ncbi:hypothetical protein [Parabacteroides faecis]|uniref:hypothetical protein n=1 Tax=Parabacteroides faecis TaxID=1217282 RepID=UPI0021646735|nr:hypothetical protein [Parabacteroides faecis]MCS2891938.1 hypothetical protein [Parabacteroides faecis]UVQ44458.1 hypothetical protein NXY11_14740 [Parabacteroides faecis]
MTIIELEASKAELVREILNIDNSETIGKLRKYLSKIRSNKQEVSPCEYTLEEVRQRLSVTGKDAIAGIGISGDEMEQHMKNII